MSVNSPDFTTLHPTAHMRFMVRSALPAFNLVPYVFGLRTQNNKIRGIIIEDVAINVMNDLSLLQGTPQFFFCDDSMNVFSTLPKVDRCIRGLVTPATHVGAVQPLVVTNLTRLWVEHTIAGAAVSDLALAPCYGGTGLGAVTPPALFATRLARVHEPIIRTAVRVNHWFSPACLRPDPALVSLFGGEA